MFRDLRRKKQMISQAECIEILERGHTGVLAVLGDDDYPYAVPLNYVYHEGKLYFHSAKSGHKLEAIAKHDKASFCVIDEDVLMPQEFTTYFRSVIAFGRMQMVEDDSKRQEALEALCHRLSPFESEASVQEAIEKGKAFTAILALEIEHLSGKEAI